MRRLMIAAGLILLLAGLPPAAQAQTQRLLIPIGGGYSDIYSGLCAAIVTRAVQGQVNIVVLPSAYSTNAESISEGERQTNLNDAEVRRFEIQEACKRAGPQLQVNAVIAPVFTRADAALAENAALFHQATAVFILGGDQTVAMRAIANSPVEQALTDAYAQGTVIAGTSAGGGMLARAMLAGYNLNYAAESALKFGAADVWQTDELHGLSAGLPNAVLDQHFFQRARLSRLINAILLPQAPHIGIGVDAYTGVSVVDERTVGEVFGLYTVTVLDGQSYHAAESVQYVGPDHQISVRNLLVHMLAKNGSNYDLVNRQSSLAPVAASLDRPADFAALPQGAGALFLGGGQIQSLENNPLLAQFEQAAGGANANLLILTTGYRSATAAKAEARKYQAAFSAPVTVQVVAVDQVDAVSIPAEVTGILVIGKDQSLLNPAALQSLRLRWLAGTPLFLDNAAAALAGSVYSAHEPTPGEGEAAEAAAQRSFLQGRTQFADGLGLIPALVEPQVVNNNRWGRLFSLAYNHPDQVALGISAGTGLVIQADGARVAGNNGLFSLDLRGATLSLGENEGFEIANGLLDIFQPGDALVYEKADVNAQYTTAPTPALPTQAAPTVSPTATPQNTPTATAAPQLENTAAPTLTPTPTQPAVATAGSAPLWPWIAGGLGLLGAGLAAFFIQRKNRSTSED